jgi:hypothetical protein
MLSVREDGPKPSGAARRCRCSSGGPSQPGRPRPARATRDGRASPCAVAVRASPPSLSDHHRLERPAPSARRPGAVAVRASPPSPGDHHRLERPAPSARRPGAVRRCRAPLPQVAAGISNSGRELVRGSGAAALVLRDRGFMLPPATSSPGTRPVRPLHPGAVAPRRREGRWWRIREVGRPASSRRTANGERRRHQGGWRGSSGVRGVPWSAVSGLTFGNGQGGGSAAPARGPWRRDDATGVGGGFVKRDGLPRRGARRNGGTATAPGRLVGIVGRSGRSLVGGVRADARGRPRGRVGRCGPRPCRRDDETGSVHGFEGPSGLLSSRRTATATATAPGRPPGLVGCSLGSAVEWGSG